MGIVEATPSTLAPSVGNGGVGLEISLAQPWVSGNSPTQDDAIRFGSVEFVKHSPESSPAFGNIGKSMDLTFDDLNF